MSKAFANFLVVFLVNNSLSGHCFFLTSQLTIVVLMTFLLLLGFCADPKKIIQKNYDELTHLSVDSVLGKLFTKEVITLEQKKKIGTFPLNSDKMEYFLDNIIMPSLDANVTVKFQGFLEVMAKSDDSALTNMAKKLGM